MKTTYQDAVNGSNHIYNNLEEIAESIAENPETTDPDVIFFYGSDGTEYSVREIANMFNITLIEE